MYSEPQVFLSQPAIDRSLDMARELLSAATELRRLNSAGPLSRAASRGVAVRWWLGPSRQNFDLRFGQEELVHRRATNQILDEADQWARYWAQATNARIRRLHDQNMAEYRLECERYETEIATYQAQSAPPGGIGPIGGPPTAPLVPATPPLVVPPTAATNYYPPC